MDSTKDYYKYKGANVKMEDTLYREIEVKDKQGEIIAFQLQMILEDEEDGRTKTN